MDGSRRQRTRRTAARLGLALCLTVFAAAHGDTLDHTLEAALSRAVDAALSGRVGEAERQARRLVRTPTVAPLAQALLQDLGRKGAPLILSKDPPDPLLAELRARWRHQHHHPAPDTLPLALLRVARHHRHAVLVDVSESRMYLLERHGDHLRLATDFYVTVGKNGAAKTREGDGKTPIGVYRITGFIPPEDLSPFYGAGALPLTYPNRWDRLKGRSGDGIWIHGNPIGNAHRPPRASDGCVTLANEGLELLRRNLDPGTPVVIAQRLRWTQPEQVMRLRKEVEAAIDRWRRDWESLDTAAYLSHYAADFRSERGGLAAWRAYKTRINARKRWIRVAMEDVDLFLYPGEKDLVQAVYTQDYRSSNYRERSVKEQFWRKDATGRWRIVYEGSR